MALSDDVAAQIERQTTWADSTIKDANDFIQHLSDITRFRSLSYAEPVSFQDISITVDQIADQFNGTLNLPDIPLFSGTYTPGTIYAPAAITVPANGASPPTVTLPAAPNATLPTAPTMNFTLNGVTLPVKPNAILPEVPTIQQINLPTPPTITLPTFDGVLPDVVLEAPQAHFEYNEVPYSSELLTKLINFYLKKLDGGTGLNPVVEQQIWDRERSREAKASEASLQAAIEAMAAQGFDFPTGAMQQRLVEAQAELDAKAAAASREIAIKQAELEQENDKTFSQLAMQLEGLLIQHADRVADRALEVAKARVQLAIDIFNANVAQFNAHIARYQAQAQVFSELVQAALANAQIYRTQVESAKLEADIQGIYVELYKAQLDGVNALLGIYKTEMEAANIQMEVERNKIEAYRAEVSAYISQVQAKTAEFGMYSAQIDGEKAKVDVYARQIQAYTAEVEAQKAVAAIEESKVRASVESERVKLEQFKSEIDAYLAQLKASEETIRARVAAFEGDLKAFDAGIKAKVANAEVQIKAADVKVRQELGKVNFSLQNAIETTRRFETEAKMDIQAAEFGANLYAKLAAEAASGITSIIQTGNQTISNQ